ncbi:hypothetical protein BACT_0834 [Bifidobacterium actinocoloniiforme DSM 22766]|uniref:DUF4192 family protein n=1 Tax=Bifidobacterium actinocoloniiforme DSM 22766 TaxID=1437605 RepID=A0A086Z0T2_9BIFI|nr:DUF4192 family protein [Bifidobacterium actinocoloniiforme]KFI40132.1 hypothetical protein BACT_0834 [Bifidobacterium actinocoloniiforme DSM 22766]
MDAASQGIQASADQCGMEERMSQLLGRYRRERRERGVQEADRRWMERPLRVWVDGLGQAPPEKASLDVASMMDIGVAIAQTMTIRDAIVISMLCPRSRLEGSDLINLCARPDLDESVRFLCRCLDSAFTDPAVRPDRPRCQAGLVMLDQMARGLPGAFQVQPLAIMAYVMWWMGRGDAMDCALRALSLDEGCTLASIILAALRHQVRPAWAG